MQRQLGVGDETLVRALLRLRLVLRSKHRATAILILEGLPHKCGVPAGLGTPHL